MSLNGINWSENTDDNNKKFNGVNNVVLGISNFFSRLTGNRLTSAENEANEFSANQAMIDRQWQENMYNKYESYQGQVNQMKEAGINPALMYSNGSSVSSVGSGSSAASVSPSSSLNPIDLITSLASTVMAARQNQSAIDLNKARAKEAESRAQAISDKTPVEIQSLIAGTKLTEGQVDKLVSDRKLVESQILLNSQHLENAKVEKVLTLNKISLTQAQEAMSDSITYLNYVDADNRTKIVNAQAAYYKAQTALAVANEKLTNAHTDLTSEQKQLLKEQVRTAKEQADKAGEYWKETVENLKSTTKLNDKHSKWVWTKLLGGVGTVVGAGAAVGALGIKLLTGPAVALDSPGLYPSESYTPGLTDMY